MSKIILILTCAIQMINVIAIEPGIRDQKYISAIVCVCHLCLRSQYSLLLQKFQQLLLENRVPVLDGERMFRARKRPKTIYWTVK